MMTPMAKTIELTVPVNMQAGAVRARLLDADILRSIALAAGAIAATATVDGAVTTIVRTMEVPQAAHVMVKGASIDVTERRVWELSGAAVEITVEGLPVTMVGTLDLKETGDHCVVQATGTVTARMGFASPLVETLLRERMIEAIRAELEALR